MFRMLVLAGLATLLVTAGSAAGDGCPATTCGAGSISAIVPGSRLLILRPAGTAGPLVGYDIVSRKLRFRLPSGILSADGRRFVSALGAGRSTRFARYDARTGLRLAAWSRPGSFGLTAVSATARWLAVVRFGRTAGPLHVEIADGSGGRASRTATLPATEQPEAVSPDGRRLFLVRSLDPQDPLRYRLDVYDFATRKLRPNPPRNEAAEKMTGIAQNAVATTTGRWLLTVYVNPQKRYAFVHALDLRSGIAHCIDLDGGFDASGTYAIVLSRDERTAYVAAPLAGMVHVVDLATLRDARSIRFARAAGNAYPGFGPNAAASPVAGASAFTLGASIWTLRGGVVTRHSEQSGPLSGVAFTPAGRLVALVGGRVVAVR